jgi:integrase
LPTYSNAWFNTCLKELARYLNYNEPMIKYRTKRGVPCIVYKNKEKKQHYTMGDHITTHTMRRTAITTLMRLGMPADLVRKISGHTAGSKEFYRSEKMSIFKQMRFVNPYNSLIINLNHYSFGSPMPGRQFNSVKESRQGFKKQ